MYQTWIALVGEPVNSTFEKKEWTTMAAISPGGETAGECVTIPGALIRPGSLLRVQAMGRWNSTAEPTFKFALCYGTTATKLLESEAIAVPSASTGTWNWRSWTRFSAVGTSGKALSSGELTGLHIKSSTTVSCHQVIIPESGTEANNGAQETTVEIGAGVEKKLFLAAECGANSASNKLFTHIWVPEILN